jgi:hypothetical protein
MPETCEIRLNFRVTVRQARALEWLATKNRSTRSAEERTWLDGLVQEQEREERERDADRASGSDTGRSA